MIETHNKAYEHFKNTREQRGLSVADVANTLHLTVTIIEQIEAGELSHRFFAPVFMSGYIRSYAKYLSLPENIVEEIVRDLDMNIPTQPLIEKSTSVRKEKCAQPRIKKILSYILIVAVLIIIAFFWHSSKRTEPPQKVEQTQSDENFTAQPQDLATEDTPIESQDDSVTSPLEENTAPQLEQDTSDQPEENATALVENTPPVEDIPAPVSTPIVTKKPVPVKKVTTPLPATSTQPEVIDAQETI